MSKNRSRPLSDSQSSGSAPRRAVSLPVFVRLVVSLLLVWHLVSVVLAPWSVWPQSELVLRLAQGPPVQWYIDALYLNHGYHFFAPDPAEGEEHLVHYEVLDRQGGVIHEGEFPNKKGQWPRLRYHRYLMLADQAGLPSPNQQEREYWERTYLECFARHLLRQYEDGEMVRLRRIAHYPLHPRDALEGRKLDDPETYRTLREAVQRRSDLEPDVTDQGGVSYGHRHDVAGRGWRGGVR